jgi:hypothetical protein
MNRVYSVGSVYFGPSLIITTALSALLGIKKRDQS